VGNEVRLRAILPVAESIPFDLYFWGDHDDPNTIWRACPGGANEMSDCSFADNRSILHIWGTIDFNGTLDFDFDNGFAPTIVRSPATAAAHASITASYPGNAILSSPWVFSNAEYELDLHWHSGVTSIPSGYHGDEDYSTGGTLDMSGFSVSGLELTLRYYPQLPAWAFDNEWHNSIRMAYALEYKPPGTGPCIVDGTCLYLEDSGLDQSVVSFFPLFLSLSGLELG